MEKKSYYAIIPASIRYDKRIRANAKLLYGEITALCNEKGYCWASNNYFAELYGVSKVSVSLWIKELESCGYISCELIYKSESKEVESRHISLIPIQENLNTPIKENLNTPIRKVKGGIKEKLKDNNTVNNTINNNYIYSDIEKIWITTWRRLPNIPEQDLFKTEILDKFGFDKAKRIMKESALDGFKKLKTLVESLDNNGNIKPRDNGNNKGFSESINDRWDKFTDSDS